MNQTSENQPNETNHQMSTVLPSSATENPYTFLIMEHQLQPPGMYFGIKLVGKCRSMSQCSTETEKGWGYFHVKETVCKKSVSSESMEHCDLIQLMGRHLLIDNTIFIVHKQSGGKVMFSHLSVSHSVQRRCVAGGMCGRGHVW